MSNLVLSPLDKLYVDVDVTATLADGTATTVTGADVALIAPHTVPDASTVWTAATYANGVATVLVAGPDADPTGALVVPATGADVWVRITDIPEVQTALAGRLLVS